MRLCLPFIVLVGCSSGDFPANAVNAQIVANNVASDHAAQPEGTKAQPAVLPPLDRATFIAWCERDYRSTADTDPAYAQEFCRGQWPTAEAGLLLADAVVSLARAPGSSPPTLAEARAAFPDVRWQAASRDTRQSVPDALAEGRAGELDIYLRGTGGVVTAISFHSFIPDSQESLVIADWVANLRGRGATRTAIGCPEYDQGSFGVYGPPEAGVYRLNLPGRPPIAYLDSTLYQGMGHENVGSFSSVDVDLTGVVPTLASLRSGRWRVAGRIGDVAGWGACQ